MPKYLLSLRKRVRDLGSQNVAISLGEPHDPRSAANSLDVAILVHMYHEIAQPYELLYNLAPALKPGARVGIVDAFAPTSEHGMPPSLLRCELTAVGYREIGLDRLNGSNAYLAIFAPPSVASRTRPEAVADANRHSNNKPKLRRITNNSVNRENRRNPQCGPHAGDQCGAKSTAHAPSLEFMSLARGRHLPSGAITQIGRILCESGRKNAFNGERSF